MTYHINAISRFFARLIQKGLYTLETVPDDVRDQVKIVLGELEPYQPREGEFEDGTTVRDHDN